jgi:hypothetical protein
MRAVSMAFFVLAACSKPYVPVDDTNDTDVVDTDTEVDTDTDSDTDVPETDGDGDGWSVEDGDCDDDDIWVNPAWDERPDDDKDNDCDGRVDEVFVGLRVFEYDTPKSHIHYISAFGDFDPHNSRVDIPGELAAVAMVDALDGDGWVVLAGNGIVYQISAAGVPTLLWDDSQTEYPQGEGPLGYFSLKAHPDGYYLVDGADRLWKVEPGKETVIAAQWDCLEDPDQATELCPLDLAIDPKTGEAGLFGYFGGFGTYTEAGGFSAVIPDVLPTEENPFTPYAFTRQSSRDQGGFYAMGQQFDTSTGALVNNGFFRWNPETSKFVFKAAWGDGGSSDYTPADFTVEDGTGDFYVSTNGGWERALWRVTEDGSTTADLYRSAQDRPDPDFGPVLVVWDQD